MGVVENFSSNVREGSEMRSREPKMEVGSDFDHRSISGLGDRKRVRYR